jgi:hypothetical protein
MGLEILDPQGEDWGASTREKSKNYTEPKAIIGE